MLAGEGCGEGWLPYLDLMLSLQVSRERYCRQRRPLAAHPFLPGRVPPLLRSLWQLLFTQRAAL